MMGKDTKDRDYRVVHLDQGDSLVGADGGDGATRTVMGGEGEQETRAMMIMMIAPLAMAAALVRTVRTAVAKR